MKHEDDILLKHKYEMIKIIKAAPTPPEAKEDLMKKYEVLKHLDLDLVIQFV